MKLGGRNMENRMSAVMNSNFRVKLVGCGYRHMLVGWSGLVDAIGYGLAKRGVQRAMEYQAGRYTLRLRRGLRVEFYPK